MMNFRRYGIRFIEYPFIVTFLFAILVVVIFQQQPLQEHPVVLHTPLNFEKNNKVIPGHLEVQFEDNQRAFPVAIADEHQEGIYVDNFLKLS